MAINKSIATLHWEACETCSHGEGGGCDIDPNFNWGRDIIECSDYNEQVEEGK